MNMPEYASSSECASVTQGSVENYPSYSSSLQYAKGFNIQGLRICQGCTGFCVNCILKIHHIWNVLNWVLNKVLHRIYASVHWKNVTSSDAWQRSEYYSSSECTRILNMLGLHEILTTLQRRCLTGSRIFLRFQIWQGSKYVRVTQGSKQNAPFYQFLIGFLMFL